MKLKSIHLIFKTNKDITILNDISEFGYIEIIHYLTKDSNVIDINEEEKTLTIKVDLEVELESYDLDTFISEIDFNAFGQFGEEYDIEYLKCLEE